MWFHRLVIQQKHPLAIVRDMPPTVYDCVRWAAFVCGPIWRQIERQFAATIHNSARASTTRLACTACAPNCSAFQLSTEKDHQWSKLRNYQKICDLRCIRGFLVYHCASYDRSARQSLLCGLSIPLYRAQLNNRQPNRIKSQMDVGASDDPLPMIRTTIQTGLCCCFVSFLVLNLLAVVNWMTVSSSIQLLFTCGEYTESTW